MVRLNNLDKIINAVESIIALTRISSMAIEIVCILRSFRANFPFCHTCKKKGEGRLNHA